MPKTHVLLALVVLSVAPAAAVAGSGEYQSLDAMGLASGKGMKTPCKVRDYEGKNYCFRNEDAKAEFMKDAAGNRSKADTYYGSNQAIQTGRRATTVNHRPISPTAAISG
jgi:hypothetical protein